MEKINSKDRDEELHEDSHKLDLILKQMDELQKEIKELKDLKNN